MFALTHVPSPNMDQCELTHREREPIDLARAARQHAAYCDLLQQCGYEVQTLDANRDLPDCVFIEDAAIVLDEVAILTSMGASSRRAEPAGIEPELRKHREIRRIVPPATIEGGDVLRVGRTIFVGRSSRTNEAGVAALDAIAQPLGYHIIAVPVHGCLHFKSACTALPDGSLLVHRTWLDTAALDGFNLIDVPVSEPEAANVGLFGEWVCLKDCYPATADLIRERGFKVRTIDLSEFAKAEGCVTCLSLLFDDAK